MTAKTLRDYVAAAVTQAPPGQRFTLASGRTSGYYVDMRRAILDDGRAMGLAADALHAILPPEVEAIGGVPTAGLLLIGPLLIRCHERDDPSRPARRGFYTRAEPKAHGLGGAVEGHHAGIACLVEDTVSTGGSLIRHAGIAREAGLDVRYALAVLDRDQGAPEALRREGITLLSCLRVGEVL